MAQIGQNISDLLGSENIQASTPWIFSFYILVIGFKLVRSVHSWISFKKEYRCGLQKPPVDLKLFTELKTYQFGIKKKVTLWLSTTIHTPVTFGFFKPVILLPVALVNNISTEQAETLILHELTHIRTNDYLLNWLLLLTDTVFFFNPFVTELCNKIRMEREKNCDMAVMAFKYSPALYAETLLHAERIKKLVPDFQMAAVNRKKHLLQRIRFFSANQNLKHAVRFNMIAPLAGLLILLVLSSVLLLQAGSKTSSIQPSLALPYLPVHYNELANAEIVNTELPAHNNPAFLQSEAEKQRPALETEINKPEPLVKSVQLKTEEAVIKEVNENFAMPVSLKENDAAKQIIVKEESSGSSNASVKVYYLSFENGQWLLTPEWALSAKEIPADSLRKRIDTSLDKVKRIFPAQQ